ncbi:type II toxin-antitoxin system VapC family toxin [Massilia sp. S19_KUP03_FR1]|uniref:type II toxin-antitoxin system VapC family toxin n=1 Tax=Massilia sp. S19_KUP03_FR1 TaxID=3025503 RepID=UPI002FCCFCE0
MYLLDTNVVSEFRKREQANPGVIDFFARAQPDQLYLCVQVVGEIQAGIEKLRQAGSSTKVALYQAWLEGGLLLNYSQRILPFDTEAARMWGTLNAGVQKDPHTSDRQMAAIALLRPGMTMVTRDTASPGFLSARRYGLALLNPFT